jgi:diaminopimelate decarboxylase
MTAMTTKKRPFVSKEKLEEIIAQYPTPFHLYDERGIRENARRLKRAFSWNRGFKEFFAVKATPNPVLIKLLKEEGCGVDCSSMTELMLSEACGFSGKEIMFSSNDTPECEFIYARQLGATINLDDLSHVEFLERCAGIPETICCRFNPGGDFVLENRIMGNPKDAKYGFTREQLREGYLKLREKGAKRFGLHAFLASNTLTGDYYPALARLLFETAVWLKDETGIETGFVNLSGGIGIPYRPGEKPNDIFEIASGVERAFREVMEPAGMGGASIYTELGRFMLAPYGCLVATVLHEKNTYKNYLGLDACAVNLIRPAMSGAYHHITISGKEDEPEQCLYDVTGSLCENNDKFAIDRRLPKAEIGDRVIIHDTGAHGFSKGYNYNGRLKSAELLLREDGSVELIRRAETAEDYFATLDVTGVFKDFDLRSREKIGRSRE